MGLLNNAAGQQMAAPQGNPREMNVKERVLNHEQRLSLLQDEHAQLRQDLGRLAQMLIDQFGLVVE